MHEMGIADSVLEAVRHESGLRSGAHVVKVGLRIGELAAVDPESLRFCFEALVSGTDLDPLALEIEICPRRYRCPLCEEFFRGGEFPVACPKCGSGEVKAAGGDELEFAFMEIEET